MHSGFIGSIHDVPEEDRFNEHIGRGYRCQYVGVYGVGRTLFMIHNETFNIWSHLLGAISFVVMLIYVLCAFPNMSADGQLAMAQFGESSSQDPSLTLD